MTTLKDEFIIMSYNEALSRHRIHIAMSLMEMHEDVLLHHDKKVLAQLIQTFYDSTFLMDTKLAMLKKFLPRIQFQHVDMLITCF